MASNRSTRPSATQLIPSLGVLDIDRAISFYRQFFGFEVQDSYEDDEGSMTWCWLKARGADLMLQQLSEDQQITLHPAIGQSWVIYIRVDDLGAVHTTLKDAGLTVSDIAETSYGASEFFVTDPDGYELWVSVPAANGNGDDDEDEDEEEEPDDDEDEDEEEDDDEEEEWQVDPVRPKSAVSSR
jgi:uncharacterized glyoxalase superfamily protein PhnB